jgi:hypothetical protein
MKVARFTLLLSALLLFLSSLAHAQPGKKRVVAHRAIRKTAAVIIHAHKQVKQNKVYTGNLARAVRHQRYARWLFHQGKYVRAIHHTRRARQLAFLAINANKGSVNKEWEPGKDESQGAVDDKELEKELPKDTEGLTDEQLILQELTEIDLEEAAVGPNGK